MSTGCNYIAVQLCCGCQRQITALLTSVPTSIVSFIIHYLDKLGLFLPKQPTSLMCENHLSMYINAYTHWQLTFISCLYIHTEKLLCLCSFCFVTSPPKSVKQENYCYNFPFAKIHNLLYYRYKMKIAWSFKLFKQATATK